MKRILFMIMLALAFGGTLFAAANGSVYNQPVSILEKAGPGQTFVMYHGVTQATAATDSIGTHYTKAMWIPELTQSNCYYNMVMYNSARGTEDCNVYTEYSYDRSTWFAGAAASGVIKDQLTTTMVGDTVNVIDGAIDTYYRTAPWMRLKFVFQKGNPIGTYVTWKLVFRKDPETIGLVGATANKI